MRLKLVQRGNSKTAKATGDLIGNEIANKITKVSKISQRDNSETLQMRMIEKDKNT